MLFFLAVLIGGGIFIATPSQAFAIDIEEITPRGEFAQTGDTYAITLYFNAYDLKTNTTINADLLTQEIQSSGTTNQKICCQAKGSPNPVPATTTSKPSSKFSVTFEDLQPGMKFDIEFLRSDGSKYGVGDGLTHIIPPLITPGEDNADYTLSANDFSNIFACDDDIDNDSDTKVDFKEDGSGDPNCESPSDPSESACEEGEGGYCLLAPLPGIGDGNGRVDITSGIGSYLLGIIRFIIALCGVLAVFMIVVAGIQYMSTDAVSGKEGAKEKISHSIFGLIIALGAYIIFNTINPQLVNFDTTIAEQVITIEDPTEFTSGGGTFTGGTAAANVNTNIDTYDALLKSSCSKYGVDCTLAKAHMYAESAGDPNAQSNFVIKNKDGSQTTGHAYGLMQLTEPTFKSLGYDVSKIKDPATNIDAGVKYMKQLVSTACGGKSSNTVCTTSNVIYRIAAYNGGPGANKVSTSCPGQTYWQCTLNKGYAETRNYVTKVQTNQQKLTANNWGCNPTTSTNPYSTNNILSGGSGTSSMTPNITNITTTSATLSGTLTGTYENGVGVGYKLQKLPIPPLATGIISPLTPNTLGVYSVPLTPLTAGTYKVEIVYKASTSSQEQILGTKSFTVPSSSSSGSSTSLSGTSEGITVTLSDITTSAVKITVSSTLYKSDHLYTGVYEGEQLAKAANLFLDASGNINTIFTGLKSKTKYTVKIKHDGDFINGTWPSFTTP